MKAGFDVTVSGADDDGVVKVLAIGDSFSEDAIENYLYDLASAENISMVIGNLYIRALHLSSTGKMHKKMHLPMNTGRSQLTAAKQIPPGALLKLGYQTKIGIISVFSK